MNRQPVPPTRFGDRFDQLRSSLRVLEQCGDELERWGASLARVFRFGGKVIVAGNGGSAALAAHLTAELVGRFDRERQALPAIWLGADQATLTALANDYGIDHLFARQVEAFARPGDVVLLLSTSGRSSNLLHAARRAAASGASCWALTGARPNPLVTLAERSVSVPGSTAVVQEVHQVAIHLLCERLEVGMATDPEASGVFPPRPSPPRPFSRTPQPGRR
jgi:phosphoheptose isomerase